jgi:hypothetical protein
MKKAKKILFIYLIFNNYLINIPTSILLKKNILTQFIKNIKNEAKPKNLTTNFLISSGLEYGAFKYNKYKNNDNSQLNSQNIKEIFTNATAGTLLGAFALGPSLSIIRRSKIIQKTKSNIQNVINNNQSALSSLFPNFIKNLTKPVPERINQNITNILYSGAIDKITLYKNDYTSKLMRRLAQNSISTVTKNNLLDGFPLKQALSNIIGIKIINFFSGQYISSFTDTALAEAIYKEENKSLNNLLQEIKKTQDIIDREIGHFNEERNFINDYLPNNKLKKNNEYFIQKYKLLKSKYEQYNKLIEKFNDITKKEINEKKYSLNISEQQERFSQHKDTLYMEIENIELLLKNLKIISL